MQLVQLRHRAVCKTCGSKLPPRADAYVDEATGTTICPTCQRLAAAGPVAAPATSGRRSLQDGPHPGDDQAPPATAPRRSAYQRPTPPARPAATPAQEPPAPSAPVAPAASAAPPAPVVEPTPVVPPAAGLPDIEIRTPGVTEGLNWSAEAEKAPPPSSSPNGRGTRLPVVGPSLAAGSVVDREVTEGDNAIRRALEAARPHGLEILRSQPWMGTRVESEHVVIAPSGVWVVDGLSESEAPFERDLLSGHQGAEILNVVGGKVSVISGLLFDSEYQWMPVRGALCFDGKVPGWYDQQFTIAGVSITTPRELIDSFFSPLRANDSTRRGVATHLMRRF